VVVVAEQIKYPSGIWAALYIVGHHDLKGVADFGLG
tara:strand:+ start:245 stop:352 length:108 start_codon:yes stop_codon:yes gene_type:complete